MLPNPSSQSAALQACGVVKRYGSASILDGIDLTVPAGESFGLLGLNGAGKTTLIKCMLDFCSVDGGSFKIFGVLHTSTAARARMAFVPERFMPPHYLTCREFIELTCELAGCRFDPDRAGQLLDQLGLERTTLERPVRQLSKGMTQKLGLAGCLLVDRDLYVLDEPMSGLDPAGRIAVKSVLARMKLEGRTLFFTSHVLADVEELCTSIAILHCGEIRFHGTPGDLCERHGGANLEHAFMRCIHDPESAITA